MAISVSGLDQPFQADEYIRQLMEDFALRREARLQQLLDSGVTADRIAIVTYRACDACHGIGWVTRSDVTEGKYQVIMCECPNCPGLCVDGTPVVANRT